MDGLSPRFLKSAGASSILVGIILLALAWIGV